MRALIVKTSSMGDLIHTLPAVTDAQKNVPGIRFDWVAEESFAEIPAWHTAIDRVIPVAIRRWRKNWLRTWRNHDMGAVVSKLRAVEYDYVIDAQGLIKSAIICRMARGQRYGMDFYSCREALAALAYQTRYSIPRNRHAIDRVRRLFANVLGYSYSKDVDYGLGQKSFGCSVHKPYLVFLHGASWRTKRWKHSEWRRLVEIGVSEGFSIYLPSGNDDERRRAQCIAEGFSDVHVLHSMSLTEVAGVLFGAAGVVGVDTGLSHLAAALNIPAVTLYLATNPDLTGTCGRGQTCLVSGTFAGIQRQTIRNQRAGLKIVESGMLTAAEVWGHLSTNLRFHENRGALAAK